MKFSIIIPVYNRPDEVDELLQSLCEQTVKDFEVIIVEDGSINPCKDVCSKYAGILSLHYYAKENSGPGQSRNYGAERANGKYVIILDSDVVLPSGYLQAIEEELAQQPCEAFGCPPRFHTRSEGHQLFDDLLLYDGWHPRWEGQARQVLSPFV